MDNIILEEMNSAHIKDPRGVSDTITLHETTERLRAVYHRLSDASGCELYGVGDDLCREIERTLPWLTLNLSEVEKHRNCEDNTVRMNQVSDTFHMLDQLLYHMRSMTVTAKAQRRLSSENEVDCQKEPLMK